MKGMDLYNGAIEILAGITFMPVDRESIDLD
jgi:hypothetical protein